MKAKPLSARIPTGSCTMLLKKAENAESAISEKHAADSSEEKSAKALPDEYRHALHFNVETRSGRTCPNLR